MDLLQQYKSLPQFKENLELFNQNKFQKLNSIEWNFEFSGDGPLNQHKATVLLIQFGDLILVKLVSFTNLELKKYCLAEIILSRYTSIFDRSFNLKNIIKEIESELKSLTN